MSIVFCAIKSFGLFGTGWCSLLGDQEPELGGSLSRKPQEGPVINPQNGYIFDFMSRGIDKTSQSLFGNLTLGALKKRIFKYNPLERVEATPVISADGSVVYYVPKFIKKFFEEITHWDEIKVYKSEKHLNRLLDASVATFERSGYASQVLAITQYGVSAVSIYFSHQWKAVLVDISTGNYSDYLENDFVEAIKNLPEDYDEQSQEKFVAFINDYGMHYLRYAQFGGMLLLESKVNKSFVDTVSVEGYKAQLKANLARVVDFDDKNTEKIDQTIFNMYNQYDKNFTYGGDELDITDSQKDIKQWLDTIKFNPVLLDGYDAAISKLIEIVRPESANNKAARAFDKAIEVAYKKYRIRAYLEALEVVRANPHGRTLSDQFSPVKLSNYFRSLLNQTDPNIDATYEDNAQYAVESIISRGN